MENKKNQIFNMNLKINNEEIKMKKFVADTFACVIEGLKCGLKSLPEKEEPSKRKIEINYNNDVKKRVLFHIGEKRIPLNPYVQEMIANTICGFILSLNNVPDSFGAIKQSLINIEYKKE